MAAPSPEKSGVPVSMQVSACEGEKGITFVVQPVCWHWARIGPFWKAMRVISQPEAACARYHRSGV